MLKNRGIFIYQGIARHIRRFWHQAYYVDFEIFEQDGMWHSELESYDDTMPVIAFHDKSRRIALEQMKRFFVGLVERGEALSYIRKGYDITPDLPNILLSVREIPVGYHVSSQQHRDSIRNRGIIPNGCPDPDVQEASILIDSKKPGHIPSWIRRSDAVYAHPIFSNYMLTDGYLKNNDLYAVYLNPSCCWVGSEGIGGFCLFDRDFTEEDRKKHIQKNTPMAKQYWKYSCSLEEFIQNGPEVQRKDKYYGLDEILIPHPITKHVHIGSWDEAGKFHPNPNFEQFVRPEFQRTWQDILGHY